MSLLTENRDAVNRILSIGVERSRVSDDANRIASRLGIMRYLYLADQVRQRCPLGTRLLDIGGGYGQVSFFLKSWGYDVTVFEMRPHYKQVLEALDISYHIQPDGSLSMYPAGAFDGVIEVAVLELIGDKPAFIRNVRHLLSDRGLYFSCMFPNKDYWVTRLGIRGLSPYAGPRRYNSLTIARMFEDEGFLLEHVEQYQFFPMNLLKVNPNHLVELVWSLSSALCRMPGIGNLSNNFNLIFRRV